MKLTKAQLQKGKLVKTSWIIMLSVIFCFPIITHAIDCTPLDPRGKITKEDEKIITGKVEGLFKKLLNIGGEFQHKVKETVDNLHGQLHKTESQAIKEKVIYLYCEALKEAKIEQQITLINSLQNSLGLRVTGTSGDIESSKYDIRSTGYASITWQCKTEERPCPSRAELKRRATRVAQMTAQAALGQQLEVKIRDEAMVKEGKLTTETIEQTVTVRLKGIQYDEPVEKDDEVSIRARLALPSQ